MNIDIEKISEIKDELHDLKDNDVLFIDEEGKTKYAVMNVEMFDNIEDVLMMLNSSTGASVRIASPDDIDLSYEEYERIKRQILEAVEKTFMPKPEKLN
ncbi:MAG: hypothetical protein IK151_05835 [Erysipelotrichaceae bacterium]|nr:hypothetical protein [Erysipelotrichaceae bacterium]